MKRSNVIKDTYDAERTYTLPASCSTCGWDGWYERAFGYEPRSLIACPECGCRTVHTRTRRGLR